MPSPHILGTPAAHIHAQADVTGLTAEVAALRGNWLTVGEETLRREMCSTTFVTTGSGTLRLAFFTARKTETITKLRMFCGGQAAGATPTLCRAGVYSVGANNALALLAAIANDTTLFATLNTAYLRSFSGGNFSKVAGVRYAVGTLVVTGATVPNLYGQVMSTPLAISEPWLGASVGGQTDLPASVAAFGTTASGQIQYTEMLP